MIVQLDLGNATRTARTVDAFAKRFAWQANIQDPAFPNDPTKTIPNPETKLDHYKRRLIEYSRDVVGGVEEEDSLAPVREAAKVSRETIVIT